MNLYINELPLDYFDQGEAASVHDIGSLIGGLAGPLIGGLFGMEASNNQAGAIQDSGAATAAAANRATDAQVSMFNTQNQDALSRYNAVQRNLSSLFGGNISGGFAPGQMVGGNIFGPQTTNNPQLQDILAQLRGSGTQLSNLASGLQPLLSQFGNTATSQLQQFNSFNPQTMAQDIYSKLTALGQPQREQDRANLESRLLNQGILTSTPGFSQINSMDQANSQQDLARQIQAQLTAQSQLQALLQNAQGAAGTVQNLAGAAGTLTQGAGNMATAQQNVRNAALSPALQAAGISAGVPVSSSQPIPTGALSVAGTQAQGQANVNAANITNSFWNSIGNQIAQNGSNLFSNLSGALNNVGIGGVPINTAGQNLGGADGLFAMLNGYGGGV